MITAIYPGSFDPVSNGHLDIIKRASGIFDRVVIAILNNRAKRPLFDLEERIEMLEEVTQDLPNVTITSFDGLLVDFSKKIGANVIIRGIRAVSDFESELMMAQTNKQLYDELETMFFATSAKYSYISSSTIREIASFGGEIDQFVPQEICERVYGKYKYLQG